MIRKNNVRLGGIKPEILLAAMICKPIVESYGVPFVITSLLEGTHGAKSLHYRGLAMDFRTREIPAITKKRDCRDRCALALGSEFDVVLEKDHMHVEFDPD